MFDNPNQVLSAVRDCFGGKRILVVGDLMLDRYMWGTVERISPEAPVPVVRMQRETEVAGGAANVARNLALLGITTSVAGFVGDDPFADRLRGILSSSGIASSLVLTAPGYATITKSRVMAGNQQLIRIDNELVAPDLSASQRRLLQQLPENLASEFDLVILSDYAKGTLGEELCRHVIGSAKDAGIAVLVDPKGNDYRRYAGATTISPNRSEMATAAGVPSHDLDALLSSGVDMRSTLGLEFLTITLGELGMALVTPGGVQRFPTMAKQVFDVSGAGDTVIATLGAGLSAGLAVQDAVRLSNLAAGVVIGKVGTAPIEQPSLLARVTAEIRNEDPTDSL